MDTCTMDFLLVFYPKAQKTANAQWWVVFLPSQEMQKNECMYGHKNTINQQNSAVFYPLKNTIA